MPRHSRLDTIGLLHHVMARGIEKRPIFLDDHDRTSFVTRFSNLLLETGTNCVAWSLMTNHFHLLLRPQNVKLSYLMRRLLTGYVVYFNLRHDRVGHLFQNRYKSVVCEEESYFLELVRYIHLNPVRAGIVPNVEALEEYSWSGHAVLLGNASCGGQNVPEILLRFDTNLVDAKRKYKIFVQQGEKEGHREEFCGGGLARSAALLNLDPSEEAFDDRILGSGEFVVNVVGDPKECQYPAVPLERLLDGVAEVFKLDPSELCQPTKRRIVAEARAAACYIGIRKLGYRATDVAKALKITPSSATVAERRGRALAESDRVLGLISTLEV